MPGTQSGDWKSAMKKPEEEIKTLLRESGRKKRRKPDGTGENGNGCFEWCGTLLQRLDENERSKLTYRSTERKMWKMDKAQLLLMINSILLSFLSVMFIVIGYFLKDLHKDFKQMVERVNNLYSEHNTHVKLSQNFDTSMNDKVGYLQRQVKRLNQRCEKLETPRQ
jgi:hypothetical protein